MAMSEENVGLSLEALFDDKSKTKDEENVRQNRHSMAEVKVPKGLIRQESSWEGEKSFPL